MAPPYALLMRAAVPSGYMVSQAPGGPLLSLCAGSTNAAALDREAIATLRQLQAIAAQNKAGHEPTREAAKVCPYAVLAQASLPGADPILLEAALAFVLALGISAHFPRCGAPLSSVHRCEPLPR